MDGLVDYINSLEGILSVQMPWTVTSPTRLMRSNFWSCLSKTSLLKYVVISETFCEIICPLGGLEMKLILHFFPSIQEGY
mmetsp:Transcript_40040/g.68307  ORF Transcript_40040/g.68307 Transcript_40040/m.68307 type:complete len:80 (+) Transcript_40040:31-270(+)